MIEEKNFSKLVDIVEVVGYQQFIINNQPVRQEVLTTNVCCPECGTPILQFQVPKDEVAIHRSEIAASKQYPDYCPHCGQKLIYGYEVLETEWSVVSEEPVDESMGD